MMDYMFYVGTYTRGKPGEEHRKQGIFVYHMDSETGRLEQVAGVESGPNPSFLALHPNGKFLYATNETRESFASAFALDGQGKPVFLNQEATQGADACYASFDPSGRWLMVANYSSGSLAVFPVGPDGRLGAQTDLVQHHGHGPDAQRQENAHAHSIRFDPSKRFALAADLGIDKVMIYRLEAEQGKLIPNDPPWVDAQASAGPRHMEWHPNGRILYVANELDSTVSSYTWDAQAGKLRPLESHSTLPEGFNGENTVADIHLNPSGAYLYVSNRGHNSLAAFRVGREDGALAPAGIFPSGGNWPRNFAIDPAGKFLLAANQYSGNLAVFRIEENGALTPTGEGSEVPSPVCIVFRRT